MRKAPRKTVGENLGAFHQKGNGGQPVLFDYMRPRV